jgi:hypothetical protein
MSDFNEMLADLQALYATREDMLKAMPKPDAEDAKVKAAAADDNDNDDNDKDDNGDEEDGDEDDSEPMSKSFMTDANGQQFEVMDATDLIKSLTTRLDNAEGQSFQAVEMLTGLVKTQSDMIKALGESQKSQTGLIKSLQSQVAAFGSKGRGRASASSVPHVSRADQPATGLPPEDFMMKALAAQAAGRLTSIDIAMAESYLQRGMAVPVDITSRVFEG